MICVNRVTVSPGSVTLKEGNWYYGASASVSPNNATCGNVRWYSNNSSVATVNSSNGYIYANGVGTTRVYAQATDGSGSEDYLTVTVEANTVCVSSISLSETALAMEKGEQVTVYAVVCPENATDKALDWSSTNPSVVSVNGGIVTALDYGYATVYATATDGSGVSSSLTVSVEPRKIFVTSVALNQTEVNMYEGDTVSLSATVYPVDATDPSLSWSSSAESVAEVNGGVVTAKSAGTAYITVSTNDGSNLSATCAVTVLQCPILVEQIILNVGDTTIYIGETTTYSATVVPYNAWDQRLDVYSSDPTVIEVSNGEIRGLKEGYAAIVAEAKDGSGVTVSQLINVEYNGIHVSGITMPSSMTLVEGESAPLNIVVHPVDATNPYVDIVSNNPTVADIQNGYVCAYSEGTATLTASATDGSNVSASCEVTVNKYIHVTNVNLSTTALTLKIGETSTVDATVYPENATDKRLNWQSTDSSVASVSNGVISANSCGSATITATAADGSGVCAMVAVTVEKIYVSSITVEPAAMSVGTKWYFTATVYPENATEKSVIWHSSNSNVITIIPESGYAVAEGAGSTVITATATDGSGVVGCCCVEVEPNPAESITIQEPTKEIQVTARYQMNAIVEPFYATNKTLKWYSSNEEIATIDENTGMLTGVSAGNVTITAVSQDNSDISDSFELLIHPRIWAGTTNITEFGVRLDVGESIQLTADVPITRWETSDSTIVAIDPELGWINTRAVGRAVITAFWNNMCSSQYEIVVGHMVNINGHNLFVMAEDDFLLDPYMAEEDIGLHVYANDVELKSAKKENNNIIVCFADLRDTLCTRFHISHSPDFAIDYFYCKVEHKDSGQIFEHTYASTELLPCPDDENINFAIPLERFLNDMGYSEKCSSVEYSNGLHLVFIQGYEDYSSKGINQLSAEDLASLGLSFIPVIGDIKDGIEAVYGKDLITNEELSPLTRIMSGACTFIPFLGGTTIRVGKKGITTLDNVLDTVDNLSDVNKAIFFTDIWKVLRPTTRGLIIEVRYADEVYTALLGWHHVGNAMNGFFPVIDFVKCSDNIDETIAVSLKTLDPSLYKLADGSTDINHIKRVLQNYIDKLSDTSMYIDDVPIPKNHRCLTVVMPEGYDELIGSLAVDWKGIDLKFDKIIINILEE